MPSYYARSVWYIEAPPEVVWKPLVAVEEWPDWWPDVTSAMELEEGDEAGKGSLKRCAWKATPGPAFQFNLRVTRVEPEALLEAEIRGQLEGTTTWHLNSQPAGCAVHMDWAFHTNIWWMTLLGPVSRRLYPRVFDSILESGGKALSSHLDVSLLPNEEVEMPKEDMLV